MTGDAETFCIGWAADPFCPMYGLMHGCRHNDRHHGAHVCVCGAQSRNGHPPRPVARCGTAAGYKRHLRRQEQTCDECRRANALYQAVKRAT